MQDKRSEWRCRGCERLLGVIDGDRVEIRLARGHQYRVAMPVTGVCSNPRCNTLNVLDGDSSSRTRETAHAG